MVVFFSFYKRLQKLGHTDHEIITTLGWTDDELKNVKELNEPH